MDSEENGGYMYSCESCESKHMLSKQGTGSVGSGSGSSQSTNAVHASSSSISDGSASGYCMQDNETDSDNSDDMNSMDLRHWNFVEHFKKDPTGFLDEIVERYIHLNNVVKLKSNAAKKEKQILSNEKKMNSDLRQELENCRKSLESVSTTCRNLAAESQHFMGELERARQKFYEQRSEQMQEHNGVCAVLRSELQQAQEMCQSLADEKEKLVEEVDFYKSLGEGEGERASGGPNRKYKLLCAALKTELHHNQTVIQDLGKYNEDLEEKAIGATEEMQNLSAENEKLQVELKFYKNQYFDENSEEVQKNKELQQELTEVQSNFKSLATANEKLLKEIEIYKTVFYKDKSAGNEKVKEFCRKLQGELLEKNKTLEKVRSTNEKLQDKVGHMKLMLNRLDLHSKGLKIALDENSELEKRMVVQKKAIELLESLNAKLRADATNTRDCFKKLRESFKLELAKRQVHSCSECSRQGDGEGDGAGAGAGAGADHEHGKNQKLHSLLMKMVRHVDKLSKITRTANTSPSSSSSNISMSQILGRNHLKMDPEEVLEDVFKTFCDLATDYWVTQMHPMQSMEARPSTGSCRSSDDEN
ncbi:golgin subfamily A member 6C-like [Drosophila pseudoobscura]|uniref:Golgin subfamily A member 6C-like n=1 Tax=Drosophila pseudoobscura pseudoobscura TaxID=46245 RepID=A0A6I8UYT2_DROPS|nr:golgin subfamily A member 6C [Drosophila pseudoobscura]XP_033240249.1 golgin subfamily A member 6C [Drosophila pseudoobscura]